MLPPKRILCPTDLGETAQAAVRFAIELAGIFCAELVLMHVVDPVPYSISCPESSGLGAVLCVPILTGAIESAKDALRRLAADLLPPELAHRERVDLGSPADRILEAARSEGSDLIVMAMGRGSWLGRCFGPPLTLTVARRSRCPVWVVRRTT
ncbi:MAG: universal stress protein [Candidatus Bipolaricaulia bacterium]